MVDASRVSSMAPSRSPSLTSESCGWFGGTFVHAFSAFQHGGDRCACGATAFAGTGQHAERWREYCASVARRTGGLA